MVAGLRGLGGRVRNIYRPAGRRHKVTACRLIVRVDRLVSFCQVERTIKLVQLHEGYATEGT